MSEVKTYRKKPVEAEAIHWDGTGVDAIEVIKWLGRHDVKASYYAPTPTGNYGDELPAAIAFGASQGTAIAVANDHIVIDVDGKVSKFAPDAFAQTYEEVSA